MNSSPFGQNYPKPPQHQVPIYQHPHQVANQYPPQNLPPNTQIVRQPGNIPYSPEPQPPIQPGYNTNYHPYPQQNYEVINSPNHPNRQTYPNHQPLQQYVPPQMSLPEGQTIPEQQGYEYQDEQYEYEEGQNSQEDSQDKHNQQIILFW